MWQMSNILHSFCPSAVDNKEVFSVQSINGNGCLCISYNTPSGAMACIYARCPRTHRYIARCHAVPLMYLEARQDQAGFMRQLPRKHVATGN